MNAATQELYQDVIVQHNRQPSNFRALEDGRKAEGENPLCGDSLTVYVRTDDDVVTDICFQGSGCAISKASASLMTDSIKGKSTAQARIVFDRFQRMITSAPDSIVDQLDGPLVALAGVRQFPVRVKCAMLAWHTLNAMIKMNE